MLVAPSGSVKKGSSEALSHGCVDENIIIEEYSDVVGENGVVFDLRNFVKNETLKSFLPNKALVIKAQDIRDMFIPK